jgi:hypothetical protein
LIFYYEVSGTITDASGRALSGTNGREAFLVSVSRNIPLLRSWVFNCAGCRITLKYILQNFVTKYVVQQHQRILMQDCPTLLRYDGTPETSANIRDI